MAILQATGIEFSDGSVLTSLYGIVPQDKRMLFYQAAAPTNWTKVTTITDSSHPTGASIDNCAIRVVAGVGGLLQDGDSTAFTTRFSSSPVPFSPDGPFTFLGSSLATTLTTVQMRSHDHGAGSEVLLEPGPSEPQPSTVPVTNFYNSRTTLNYQTLYQQPNTTRDNQQYQQPNTTQVTNYERVTQNRQQPNDEQANRRSRETLEYQQPNDFQRPAQVSRNNQRSLQRNTRQPATTQQNRNTRVQRSQPAPVTRQANRNQQRSFNRRSPNSFNRRSPSSSQRSISRNFRRRGRRGGRRRRRNRRPAANRQSRSVNSQSPRSGSRQSPNSGSSPQSRRENRNAQQDRRVQGPASRRATVNRQSSLRVDRRSPETTQELKQRTANRREAIAYQNNRRIRANVNRREPYTNQVTQPTQETANRNRPTPIRVTVNRQSTKPSPTSNQQPVVNSVTYGQPIIIPGGIVRRKNQSGSDDPTQAIGGSQGHNHPFTGGTFDVTSPSGFVLDVAYVDVILCSFD